MLLPGIGAVLSRRRRRLSRKILVVNERVEQDSLCVPEEMAYRRIRIRGYAVGTCCLEKA